MFWYLCYTWNFIHSHTDYGNVYHELTFTLWTQTISFCSTTNEFFTRVHRHSQEHKRTEITSPYGNLLLDKALLFCRKSVSYLIDISSTHREYTPKYLRRNFIAQEILNQPKVNTIFITFFLLYFSNAPSFFSQQFFFWFFLFFCWKTMFSMYSIATYGNWQIFQVFVNVRKRWRAKKKMDCERSIKSQRKLWKYSWVFSWLFDVFFFDKVSFEH